MVRVLFIGLAAALLSAGCASAQTQNAPPAPAPTLPNCNGAAHHALDFWIGEWDAYRADNNHLAGRSSVTASDDGCVINEHWTSAGAPYSGRSLNIYDAVSGKWEQYWADSTGSHVYFVGAAGEGRVISMTTLGPNDTSPGPTGRPQWQRVTFTPLPDGTVRQQGDVSDDGQAWTVSYALIYRHHPQ